MIRQTIIYLINETVAVCGVFFFYFFISHQSLMKFIEVVRAIFTPSHHTLLSPYLNRPISHQRSEPDATTTATHNHTHNHTWPWTLIFTKIYPR